VLLIAPSWGCGTTREEGIACRAIWSRTFDGGSTDVPASLAVTSQDELIVAGAASSIDFGDAKLPPADGTSFVAKLTAAPGSNFNFEAIGHRP
jgi:hypothetical protein